MIGILLGVQPVYALECFEFDRGPGCSVATVGCQPPGGSVFLYRRVANHLPPYPNAVDDGFEVWEAGSWTVVRGANWAVDRETAQTWVPGYIVSVEAYLLGNGKSEVLTGPSYDPYWAVFEDDDHVGPAFWPLAYTVVERNPSSGVYPCAIKEADIHFHPSRPWMDQGPWTDTTKFNVQVTASHEFGHAMDLDHTTGFMNMMTAYPAGGYVGEGVHRLYEREAVYLQDHKPGSSTGTNLILSTYVEGNIPPGQLGTPASNSSDGWAQGELSGIRERCPGQNILDNNFDGHVTAMVVGTASSVPSRIQWGLRPAGYGSCSTLTTTLSSRNLSLVPNIPSTRSPVGSLPLPNLAPGSYKFCANVKPRPVGSLTELSTYDNAVTHHLWTIDVPTNCP